MDNRMYKKRISNQNLFKFRLETICIAIMDSSICHPEQGSGSEKT